ncbi:MAG: serine hydrolase [Lachnospiraceae bacterium]|nr:serine hydrolase [Lachnospiraceae bacterium]
MGKKQQNKEKEQKTKISKKQFFLTVLVLLMVVVAYLAVAFRAWDVAGATIKRRIAEKQIDKYMEQVGFNGTVVAARDGEIIFAKGYGRVDLTKGEDASRCSMDTLYPIFSLSKQFTAYAILQLEQEGKLSRTDKVSKYFENCKYGDDTTLEELLNLTAGIPEYMDDVEDYESYHSVDRDALLSKILNYTPAGKGQFKYSNSNYFLLGLIIEKVSGMTYEDYIQENVVIPAGMEKVSFDPQAADTKGFRPYDVYNPDNTEYHASYAFSAGELCTTAINLSRWQNFLYSDKAIDISQCFGDNPNETVYNLGLVRAGYYYGHTGGGRFHRHSMWYNTASHVQVIVLSNNAYCDSNTVSLAVEHYLSKY